MDLQEKYAALADRFQILAFHDATVKSFEELDQKLAPIIEKRWGGRTIPFPVLLDPTRETIRAYGISAYPTNVLIDPEGNVVPGNPEKRLEAELETLAGGDAAETTGK